MKSLTLTLKAWPVIAAATIGLCFLTQTVAGWLGVELPDQANVDLVRRCLSGAFVSAKHFGVAALLVAQVLVVMPAIEELVFRWLLVRLPLRLMARRLPTAVDGDRQPSSRPPPAAVDSRRWPSIVLAVVSSALFSAAHYIAQPWPDSAFFALFFFGLAQCRLYRKADRLWCAMLNHALFNLTNLVLLVLLPVS